MSYLGDFALGETFDTKFTTVSTTGAPTTLAGTPAVSAYVGNSTTQITAGITLTVDFDAVTGLNNVRVVATGANGYATASNYQLVITTGTVGGTSVVGYVVAEFSIENRSGLRPTTAGRTLDVSAGGEAGLDWANIGSPTTAQNLSATNIDVDQVVASVSGAVGSVTGAVGSVAAGGITAASFGAGAIDAAAIANAAIDAAALAVDTGLKPIRTGTAQAGTASTITLDAGASAVDDFYIGAVVLLTGGTGGGQTDTVHDYVGASKVATIAQAFATAPDATTTFALLPGGTVRAGAVLDKNNYGVGVGGIAATAFAAGAIDAAAIAADALGAAELAQGAAQEIADEVLNRNLAGGGSGASRNVRNALRSLRNRQAIAAGTLTVYEEDDLTSAWTAAVTTAAGNPLSEVDPA